jgi:hypothetical protein
MPCSCVESKSRISSDWLVSSSKLQPCLELCQFDQAFLKMKFARWKVCFPSLEISKEVSFVTFFRTDDVLLEVRNQEVDVVLGLSF